MTIEEHNKLIAEFMGAQLEPYPDGHFPGEFGYRFKEKMPANAQDTTEGWWWNQKSMRFHLSWDWLMPVVEKIMTHRYPDYYGSTGRTEDDGEYDDCAHFRTFGMRDNEGNYMVRINASPLFKAPTLIEATFKAVVDFITNQ